MALTVVNYHLLHPDCGARMPRLKGVAEAAFVQQLDYLRQRYVPVSMEEILDHFAGGRPLSDRACHVTFDDGHREHYTIAFPILREKGMKGTFFAPSLAVEERTLLDVHKLHLVLAAGEDTGHVRRTLFKILDELRAECPEVPGETELRARLWRAGRFDSPEVQYVKRVCDSALPAALRSTVVQRLFAAIVGEDEAVWGQEYYVTPSQLRTMLADGMAVGSHGHRHIRLGDADMATQIDEIDASLAFLGRLGIAPAAGWLMCCPYGSFSATTLRLMRDRGCTLAFSANVGVIDADADRLALPRLDVHNLVAEMRSVAGWAGP